MVWMELAQARMPNGDVLTLRRSGGDFEIRLNLYELMSSRAPVSETALAELTCGGRTHVLIGGLGMGYTVRAVLDQLGPEAKVTVAELVPDVIAWNRGPLGDLAAHPLDDPRVTVCNRDVADLIRPGAFDVILLDVDNGPEAVLFPANRALYSIEGVRMILSGLKAGGVLGLWAADRSPNFEDVLRSGGFPFERVDVAVLGNGGPIHTIYLLRAAP